MSRIRSIKPEMRTDHKIGQLRSDTWRLFLSLWTMADDYGRTDGSPDVINGAVFWAPSARPVPVVLNPRERDQIAALLGAERAGLLFAAAEVPTCEEMLRELEDLGRIRRYEVRDSPFIQIVNWHRHQRVDHPGQPRVPCPHGGQGKKMISPCGCDGTCDGRGEIAAPRGASAEARADVRGPGGGVAADSEGRTGRAEGASPPPGPVVSPSTDDGASLKRSAPRGDALTHGSGEGGLQEAAKVTAARERAQDLPGPGAVAPPQVQLLPVTPYQPTPPPEAWGALVGAAGKRLARGKLYASTETRLPQSLEARWIGAWTEAVERYGLADACRLGEWIAAGGWAHLPAVSPQYLITHLQEGLQLSGAWDGVVPAERRAAAAAEPVRPAGPADRDPGEDRRQACGKEHCDKQFHYDQEPGRPGSAQAWPCPRRGRS